LARYMTTLGLERKAKPVPALAEYISERYMGNGQRDSSAPEPESKSNCAKDAYDEKSPRRRKGRK